MEKIDESVDVESRVYEVGYLLVPTIEEDQLQVVYGNLKGLVSSFGGKEISDDMPKMMEIAYPMVKVVQNVRSKFNTAYFGWMKFFMDAEKVNELKKKLDLDPNIIRHLIIKTVKENTLATKRFVNRDGARRKPMFTKKEGENSEEATPINKEEVDKEIEKMVAE